jgi:ribosomal protein S18 acetylase RimI-like enzyme
MSAWIRAVSPPIWRSPAIICSWRSVPARWSRRSRRSFHRHPDKPTELYIDEVGVTPALQRQGIASAMLERMLALGKALGCAEAWVGTETDNGPARGLYESRGAAAEPFVLYLFKL